MGDLVVKPDLPEVVGHDEGEAKPRQDQDPGQNRCSSA